MKRTIDAWLLIFGLALVLALSLAVTATAAGPQAQGSGVIDGQVVNGTAGGPAIGTGISVTLYLAQGDTVTGTLRTTTDSAGRFRFDGLATDPELSYWPEAVYLGVSYPITEAVVFEEGQKTQSVTLPVYETTDDDSQIAIDWSHVTVVSSGTILRIREVYLFGNRGDRTYVGRPDTQGRTMTVGISLPAQAVGLTFADESAERMVQSGDRLLDTAPVPPGQETLFISYSYHLPVADGSVHMERSYDYPITVLNILLTQPGLALRSNQLLDGGLQSFGDQTFAVYTAVDLPAGDPLALDLIVEPIEATGSTTEVEVGPSAAVGVGKPVTDNQGLLRVLGLGLAGLAVLGAVLYPLLTAQRQLPAVPVSAPASNPQARPLLAELADLQEAFEAGQVDEETYQRQRAEKWEALKSL